MSLDFSLSIDIDTGGDVPLHVRLFEKNITHNLNEMAKAAGIYQELWRSQGRQASDIIPALENGLALLKADKASFEKFNPANGWGDYEGLAAFVESVLAACKQHPIAKINANG